MTRTAALLGASLLALASPAFAQTPEAAPALLAHQSALELDGAGTAWLVLLPLPPVSEVQSGGLPIDRAQGDFLLAITLTTLAATLASILPARRAARIDPVEAIGS